MMNTFTLWIVSFFTMSYSLPPRSVCFFFLMIRRPQRSTLSSSSAASDVYKRQRNGQCSGYSTPASSCNQCNTHTSCAVCSEFSSCGWCEGSQTCMDGTFTGPSAGSCVGTSLGSGWEYRHCTQEPPSVLASSLPTAELSTDSRRSDDQDTEGWQEYDITRCRRLGRGALAFSILGLVLAVVGLVCFLSRDGTKDASTGRWDWCLLLSAVCCAIACFLWLPCFAKLVEDVPLGHHLGVGFWVTVLATLLALCPVLLRAVVRHRGHRRQLESPLAPFIPSYAAPDRYEPLSDLPSYDEAAAEAPPPPPPPRDPYPLQHPGADEAPRRESAEIRAQFCAEHGLDRYLEVLDREDVRVDLLPDMSDQELKEIGIPIGGILKIRRACGQDRRVVVDALDLECNAGNGIESQGVDKE
eukprot:TRINITY_DN14697_c0_g1_i3.p1 TRINITY_DN14697_c0_g1~~TRINITY_DN14697_c0_g1_i3.p1  ORF type:complete len:412 (+),score=45.69 TRINITY_DN14697_c0_g1_i3:11-1246(+)